MKSPFTKAGEHLDHTGKALIHLASHEQTFACFSSKLASKAATSAQFSRQVGKKVRHTPMGQQSEVSVKTILLPSCLRAGSCETVGCCFKNLSTEKQHKDASQRQTDVTMYQ